MSRRRAPSNLRDKYEYKFFDLVPLKEKHIPLFTPQEYKELIKRIMLIKQNKPRNLEELEILKNYDVTIVGRHHKLYLPTSSASETKRLYVNQYETFDAIHDVHIATDHGNQAKMEEFVNKSYVNITSSMIKIYLECCDTCLLNVKLATYRNTMRTLVDTQKQIRVHIDFLDLQEFNDSVHKLVLIYRDQKTKFIVLRPLRERSPAEVAEQLIDIFSVFGAPTVLQSYDREFIEKVVVGIRLHWPHLRIFHGPVQESNEPENDLMAFQEVPTFIDSWYHDHPSARLLDAIRFAQMMINRVQTHEDAFTPFEITFRKRMPFGLPELLADRVPLDSITEEAFENVLCGTRR